MGRGKGFRLAFLGPLSTLHSGPLTENLTDSSYHNSHSLACTKIHPKDPGLTIPKERYFISLKLSSISLDLNTNLRSYS